MTARDQNAISPATAQRIVAAAARKNLSVLLVGTPGVGKTAIVAAAAREIGYAYRAIYPTDLDPVDLGGLPIPSGDRVIRMLDDQLIGLTRPDCPPTVVLVDELGQASPAMQAACAKLFHARELAGRALAPTVAVMAATNRAQDRAGAVTILSHIISRMGTVISVVPDAASWCDWARTAGIDESVRSLIAWRGELLDKFDPSAAASLQAYPCPRSWERAGSLCALGLRDDDLIPALAGCVGAGAAMELIAHRRGAAKIDFAALMRGGRIELPQEIGLLYALGMGVGARMRDERTAARGIEIALALLEKSPEIAVLLLRESTAWQGWMSCAAISSAIKGPLGEIIHDL